MTTAPTIHYGPLVIEATNNTNQPVEFDIMNNRPAGVEISSSVDTYELDAQTYQRTNVVKHSNVNQVDYNFETKFIRLQSTSSQAIENISREFHLVLNGQKITIKPIDYVDPYPNAAMVKDIPLNILMAVKNIQVKIILPPAQHIIYTFFPAQKINFARELNKPILQN